jgi:hypothetical protein
MAEKAQRQLTGADLALEVEQPQEFQVLVEFDEAELIDAAAQAMPRGAAPRGATSRGLTEQIQARSTQAIDAAMNTIREMALQTDLMRKGIPGGSQPRMVKVKFGINLDFEVGALLAKSSAGATMEVELEWARRSDDVLRVLRAETDVDGALFTDANAA